MGSLGVNGMLAAYQYAPKNRKPAESSTVSFKDSLQKVEKANELGIEGYKKYLESKYGAVMIQNVGKDQKSMDTLGASTAGTGNVVIAPNILEKMANDPEKAAYYEGKIQNYFASVPRYQAELSAMGHEIHSSGIVIHPDGTVTHYISGDLKPEVRRKIEAQIKEEQEEKTKRRQEYAEQSQEAAERRRQLMEMYQHKQLMEENIQNQIIFTNQTAGVKISPQIFTAAWTFRGERR